MTATLIHTTRELHSRTTGGIDVRLLWNSHDDGVWVTVADSRTGEAFILDVRDGECAMDVFHHPFAYAAWRELDTRDGDRDASRGFLRAA